MYSLLQMDIMIYLYIHVYMYCIPCFIYICKSVYIYIYIYVCDYICIYIYVYIPYTNQPNLTVYRSVSRIGNGLESRDSVFTALRCIYRCPAMGQHCKVNDPLAHFHPFPLGFGTKWGS